MGWMMAPPRAVLLGVTGAITSSDRPNRTRHQLSSSQEHDEVVADTPPIPGLEDGHCHHYGNHNQPDKWIGKPAERINHGRRRFAGIGNSRNRHQGYGDDG